MLVPHRRELRRSTCLPRVSVLSVNAVPPCLFLSPPPCSHLRPTSPDFTLLFPPLISSPPSPPRLYPFPLSLPTSLFHGFHASIPLHPLPPSLPPPLPLSTPTPYSPTHNPTSPFPLTPLHRPLPLSPLLPSRPSVPSATSPLHLSPFPFVPFPPPPLPSFSTLPLPWLTPLQLHPPPLPGLPLSASFLHIYCLHARPSFRFPLHPLVAI